MKKLLLMLLVILAGPGLETAQARNASDYLPADADLDPAIPTPESVLGWDVGDWHVSHDKLMAYLRKLEARSPRVSLTVTGHTHEQRPLVLLAITTEDNASRLEELRRSHLSGQPDAPLVVWLGYSVHGDEPSGSNAAMLVAYYLAASRSDFVRDLLRGSVILLDPSINPDGLNRFASWVNSNAGAVPAADPSARQHNQPWPEGRTNHYWFDLNRDWLPLVHPESRARIAQFHRWRPHVLTDHHEQGSYPGFFFQPGVPSRQNPLTPAENLDLTRALATFHMEAMDGAGQPVFIEEVFDDFYYGKGSTYPDINGSVGILFEQRAIGGQALETSNGVEVFQTAVANQLRASLSTMRGAWQLRDRLRDYQRGFFSDMLEAADEAGYSGWVVGDDADAARAREFLSLLRMHDIEHEALQDTVRAGDHAFNSGHAWFIPARQRQFGLIQALMTQPTSFEDESFYDVSAWTMPLAYNLPFAPLRQAPDTTQPLQSSEGLPPANDAVAWLISWNQLEASAMLQKLLDAGARVRTAIEPFSVQTSAGLSAFEAGTLVIQSGIQDEDVTPRVRELLAESALAGLSVHSATQGITAVGPDFGSNKFAIVRPIRPLLLGGAGISAYGAGEAWFTMDKRVGLATTIVEHPRVQEIDLEPYTHFILPSGDYSKIDPALLEVLNDRVQAGAVVVAIGGAAAWVEGMCFEADPALCEGAEANTAVPGDQSGTVANPESRPYGSYANDKARLTIGGAIVRTRLDTTHPLAFGLPRQDLAIMRVGTTLLKASENAYATVLHYSDEPLLAGFIGEERLAEFAGGPAMVAEKRGEGLVIRFANDPLFRGFWRGSERLFLNALFFGQAVETTELPD